MEEDDLLWQPVTGAAKRSRRRLILFAQLFLLSGVLCFVLINAVLENNHNLGVLHDMQEDSCGNHIHYLWPIASAASLFALTSQPVHLTEGNVGLKYYEQYPNVCRIF